MNKAVHLRTFSKDELLLTEDETRLILGFFWPEQSKKIDNAVVTDSARGFAQGLLIEAIDASYSMGFVDAVFQALRAVIFPLDFSSERKNAAVRLIKGFAKNAAAHWFKHASVHDLASVKIYESVRRTIAFAFRNNLDEILAGIAENGPPTAFVNYASIFFRSNYFWG